MEMKFPKGKGLLLCDFAFIFDYYIILIIKNIKGIISDDIVEECRENIIEQIGKNLFSEIENSEEFSDLTYWNLETFRLVDLAKNDECRASEVDSANYKRFLVKKNLQEKFFEEKLTEKKN